MAEGAFFDFFFVLHNEYNIFRIIKKYNRKKMEGLLGNKALNFTIIHIVIYVVINSI